MYKLKQTCEDFVVEEIPDFDNSSLNQESGKFICLKLTKKDWNTVSAVRELSKVLGVSNKDVNFAGTKDKNAVTVQYMSVRNNKGGLKSKFPLNLPVGLEVEFVGFIDEQLSLGSLIGNKFEIVVRNLGDEEKLVASNYFVNYFDEQRFSKNNVAIGKAIILKDFKKAASLVDDRKVKEQLSDCRTDYLKALLCLPKKILMLYIHSYQSYLWNETVSRYLLKEYSVDQKLLDYSQGKLVFADEKVMKELGNLKIPLVGALPLDSSLPETVKKIIGELLLEEGISRFDFIIKQLPNMTPEGGMRSLVAKISSLNISTRENDELNSGFEKQKLEFVLNKGSYATMAIKFLIQN
ncbi:hypothetical protein CL619_04600 [archaeon]|nr:hypothetical protein [archaeon]|tara:strand:- start:99 stop:1151 length:1053 start_codon:yes stop_codon:yes gene_type:complete